MIIYIDKSIGERGKSEGFSAEEEMLFNQLAYAHIKGDCFLCGNIGSLDHLNASLGVSYRTVKKRYSESRTLMDAVDALLVISYEENPDLPEFLNGKSRIISVDNAVSSRINEQCRLLGENLNDCAFYKLLAERYLHTYPHKIKDVNISFQDELGGGVTTDTVFEKSIDIDKHLTLCLVDSDTKHDKSTVYRNDPAIGDTARKLLKTEKRLSEKSFFELYCLPVHEAENLIPISILKEIANDSSPDMIPGIDCLEKLLSAGLEKAILFYDFKYGGTKVKGDPSITYWIEVGEKIGNDISFPRVAAGVLQQAIERLSEQTSAGYRRVVSVRLDDYLIPLWHEIGLKVFSWGCANRANPS